MQRDPHRRAPGSARRGIEGSQVNELLRAIRAHPAPFACTTNIMDRVDSAAMRRFTFRIRFRPLEPAQLRACYAHFFGRPAPATLSNLTELTPADFARVRKHAGILGQQDDDAAIRRMLAAEHAAKRNASRAVGFRPELLQGMC